MQEKITIALNPSKAFKVYMFHKDKRVTQHVVIPKDSKFSLKGNGYVINENRVFFENKVPCSVYSSTVAEPINPLSINEKSTLSSQDFYNAIEATVVQDIIRSTGKKDTNMTLFVLMMGCVTVLAVVFGIYYITDILSTQSAQIQLLSSAIEALKNSGGGAW